MAQAKRKAAKAKANAAVIMRPDDTDEVARETFRRAKEACDRLLHSDNDEHSNDQESGQKRKQKGKNNKHMYGQARQTAELDRPPDQFGPFFGVASYGLSHLTALAC